MNAYSYWVRWFHYIISSKLHLEIPKFSYGFLSRVAEVMKIAEERLQEMIRNVFTIGVQISQSVGRRVVY